MSISCGFILRRGAKARPQERNKKEPVGSRNGRELQLHGKTYVFVEIPLCTAQLFATLDSPLVGGSFLGNIKT